MANIFRIDRSANTIQLGTTGTIASIGFKLDAGSQASPLDVTSTRQHGLELHYSGNNYNVTGIRSRAQLVTTNTSAFAQGALLQAANNDGINAGVLNGALIEAIGKSDANAATIAVMRGALVNTEWGDYDTITNLKTLHVRTHSRNATGAGSFGTGYGIYIENEAVGGNGQAYDAGIYFKGTNLSAGNKAFTYGIDFSGATYGSADIKLSNGSVINDSNNRWGINVTPSQTLSIGGETGVKRLDIYVSDSGSGEDNAAKFETQAGVFIFRNITSANVNSQIAIKGNGTGYGILQIFDEDEAEFMTFQCIAGSGYINMGGVAPGNLHMQSGGNNSATFFRNSIAGETQLLRIYGRRTGDSLRNLTIGIDSAVNDTAKFGNVSNFHFDGNVGIQTATPTTALQMGDDKLIAVDVNAGITASVTQTQGNEALTAQINEISTVANDDDNVTLPAAVTGIEIGIINNGANTLLIFPASGDNLGLGVNIGEELEANERVKFVAYNTTNWAKESTTEIIHAEMFDYDNTDAYVINNAASEAHMYHTNGMQAGDLADFTFDAGGAGTSFAIASIADGTPSGQQAEITTTLNHGLAVGDIVSLTTMSAGTNTGTFIVRTPVTDKTFEITSGNSTTATGIMDQAATLEADAVAAGQYLMNWCASAAAAGANNVFDFAVHVGATHINSTNIRRKFGGAGDVGAMSGVSIITITAGDKVSFMITNTSGSGNITIRDFTLVLVRL